MTTELRSPAPVRAAASRPGRLVRVAAVASLVAEVLLVGTGAAVRLTGSGLGCPTWPRCTAASFATTPAMGAHGVIEFGNRLLTFVLVVVAVAAVVAVWRIRRSRRDLFALAIAQLASIPAQAVLGGITVLTGLNPWVVAAHFVFSLLLVTLITVFVRRSGVAAGPRALAVPRPLAAAVAGAAVAAAVVLVLGAVTTGSGPHAGDADAPRNHLDALLLSEVHGTAAFVLLGLTVAVVLAAARLRLPLLRAALLLLGVEVLQIVVGIVQVDLGWAAQVVVVHVFLAACLTAAAAHLALQLRAPVAAGTAAQVGWGTPVAPAR